MLNLYCSFFFSLVCLNCSYGFTGKHLKLDAQIRIQGRKRASANKITGIQVCSALLLLSFFNVLTLSHFLLTLGFCFLFIVFPGKISESYDNIRRLQTSYF
jgi:hypothetical protein